MFENYNHLAFYNPYYIKKDDAFIVRRSFGEIMDEFHEKRELDVLSVVEFFNKNYILGDRTLVKNVDRTPWMSKPDDNSREWLYSDVPDHAETDVEETQIAAELFRRISEEIAEYIGDKKKVGILLSGGMDSRIVAGALDNLMKTGRLSHISVCALTWGNPDSRDVVYSKEIAKRLNWDWKHYTVDAEDMLNNIDEAAVRGSEYSALHLHALPQIKRDIELDCVLAGSYGDSIGRGEYSGKKVLNIRPLDEDFENFKGILKDTVYTNLNSGWKEDIEKYHRKFPQPKQYQQYEQDYQLHYMRRMLNPCMDLIGEKTKFYQAFTAPSVFGYMWSINPLKRTDNIYKHILGLFMTNMDDIPWARTGISYGATEGTPDKYLKNHHSYQKIISTEINKEMEAIIFSGDIERLGIFNMGIIKKMMRYLTKYPQNSFHNYEVLIWLASFSKTVKQYNITYDRKEESNFNDFYNETFKVPALSFAEHMYRKYKN